MADEIQLPEGNIEVARITIVKTFTDDAEGGAGVFMSYSDDLGLLDALGMLAFAQATAPGDFGADLTGGPDD